MSAPVSASHQDPSAIEALLDRKQPGVRAVPLDLVQHWLPGNPELRLLVLIGPTDDGPRLLISDRPDRAQTGLDSGADPAALSRMLETPLLDPDAPLSLQPAAIAKPWGRELWHTGIEARGVSRVGGATQEEGIPLPWLLAALPRRYGSRDSRQLPGDPVRIRPPVLVKILDPHSDPQLGDLYFELHEHKQEVYLVTGVDPDAWPEGRGAIRMGFDPALVRQLGDAGVRRAFAEAVAAYEPVRRRIDALLDARRSRLGIDRDATLPPATQRVWLAELPHSLRAEERRCRRAVETLTALEPLAPGDLVRIPRRVPHALQHGVRVVEFQTPVYERSILFFGQKVLTQDHWDTQDAVARMRLRPPPPESPPLLEASPGVRAERVAGFAGFRVLRLQLRAGARFKLPAAAHAVATGILGTLSLAGMEITPESSCLIPGSALTSPVVAGDRGGLCLIALADEP